MSLTIHLGAHKTASTHLQQTLRGLIPRMLASGIHYSDVQHWRGGVTRLGAAHATELTSVWGNLVSGSRDVTFKLGGLKTGEALSQRMRARWANFAATAEPVGPPGEPHWAPFRTDGRSTLVIDADDRVVDDLDGTIRAAWGDQVLSFR